MPPLLIASSNLMKNRPNHHLRRATQRITLSGTFHQRGSPEYLRSRSILTSDQLRRCLMNYGDYETKPCTTMKRNWMRRRPRSSSILAELLLDKLRY